jgi:catechol-2,3-dioxygenase
MTQMSKLADIEPQLTPRPAPVGTHIGHVHLKVADIERALSFYCGVLGFALKQRHGRQAAFVSAGGYHHHIGLNTSLGSSILRSFTPRGELWPTLCCDYVKLSAA